MDRICLASIELWVVCGRLLWEMTSTKQWGCAWLFQKGRVLVQLVFGPAGFCPEAKTRGGTLGFPGCIYIRNFKM